MEEKELCFDNIMKLCQQGLLDKRLWRLNGFNHYMGYFENDCFVGAIEYHIEEEGIYLDMIEISETYRQQGYGSKIINSIKKDVKYIRCVPKSEDIASFYNKLGFKVFEPPFHVWQR